MHFLLVPLLALCAHSRAAPAGESCPNSASDVLGYHLTDSGNGSSPSASHQVHNNGHTAVQLVPAQHVRESFRDNAWIGYTNPSLFQHRASETPNHALNSVFNPSPSHYAIVLPTIQADPGIMHGVDRAALRDNVMTWDTTHENLEKGQGRGYGKSSALDSGLLYFDDRTELPSHESMRVTNPFHEGHLMPSVAQGAATSNFVHYNNHHTGELGAPHNVWYTTPSQGQHPLSGQYFHPTKTTDVHDEEGRKRRAATSRFNNDQQQAWKAPLDGFVMIANRRYQKLANVKESTARKHLNEVKNPELVGLLLEDDKDVVKAAAHIIKTLNARTQVQKGRGMASILLGDKLAGICQELKQRGNTSLSTATRKVNNCMSVELACLLRNPDTREQGIQQLLAYHQSEATTSKSQRYI